jgi:uncharacterized membrane protein
VLGRYNDAFPNGAERVFEMAERQATHRQSIEKERTGADIRLRQVGQILGFVLALVAIGGGIVLIALGKSTAGLASVIAALVALVALFVYAQRQGTASQGPRLPPSSEVEPRQGQGQDSTGGE